MNEQQQTPDILGFIEQIHMASDETFCKWVQEKRIETKGVGTGWKGKRWEEEKAYLSV